MLFPRFLNSAGISLNGIPENYAPAYPADSVVQSLTPFQIVEKAALKVLYAPAFKCILGIGPTATAIGVNVDNEAMSLPLQLFNSTLVGNLVTSTATGGGAHFGKKGNALIAGNVIDFTGFPVSGNVSMMFFEKFDTVAFNNSYGITLDLSNRNTLTIRKYNGSGASTDLLTSQAITAITPDDKLSVEITASAIIIKRNTTVLYTHNLEYKARLLNEAGTAVDANAGTLTLANDSAYANGFVAANTELKYTVGEQTGTYNVEIESELGRKILQKVIVVDTASGGGGAISPLLSNVLSFSGSGSDSPASFWNQYKTYFLIGGAFLGLSLLGAFLINRFSK